MAKLNKAEKFVIYQIESGKTRNQVREAIYEKLGTWNFPPEYENALIQFDPTYDPEPILGVDYLDDYICDHCGNCHETCFCGDHTEEAEDCIALSQIHTIPEPGTNAWEDMVDVMRKDLATNMGITKMQMAAREIVEQDGRDFDEEAAIHSMSKGMILEREPGAVLYQADVDILSGSINRSVRKDPERDAKVKALYLKWKNSN